MLYNVIVLSEFPRGRFIEGTLASGQTPKPGQHVTRKSDGTWEVYNEDADGDMGEVCILRENEGLGKLPTAAYEDGEHFYGYIPVVGDEVAVLMANLTGTGSGTDDAFAIGDKVILDDGTGKGLKTSGTPEAEVYVVEETVTTITADTLVACRRI